MTKETRTIEQTIFKAEDGTIFFDELECAVNKVCYYGALKLLSVSNDVCANSELYKRFISEFIKNQEGC